MRQSAPWNIKNESNNLLHGSVAKLAKSFYDLGTSSVFHQSEVGRKNKRQQKELNEKCGQRGEKNGLTFVCANSYRVLGVHYLCCGVVT